MADTAAAIWATPVLMRNHGLERAQFSGWLGGIILLSGILGSTISRFAADYGQKSRLRGGIVSGAAVAAACTSPISGSPMYAAEQTPRHIGG